MWLGRLGLEALKHDWIEYLAGVSMFLGFFVVVGVITRHKKWKYLWTEWITSVDHKKIGVMYLVIAAIQLIKGLVDAAMMRAQQAFSYGDSMGYLGPEHFQQIFTAHGVTMIFFVAMGIVFGLANLILPLQIGARDVAFPFLNSLSFWLYTAGSMYILISLVIGSFAGTGWTCYAPLNGLKYNPSEGVDYWLWGIQISGVGSLLSGVNFLTTILKMRCPGMKLMRMPVFSWAIFATMIMIIFAFPILTATLAMLATDRLIDTKLFVAGQGGNTMMYINLFWAWGHPEVYILVLPAFGVFSEFVPVFSRKRLFGYTSMVWAIFGISILSFIVWLHHFFTMGGGANVNAFFGIMTMIIAIPTGVKIFNWLFTTYRGKIRFVTPMYWFFAFVVIFTIGGMTGVMMAIPGVDFQAHNSLFLIAHFHTVIIGGVVFAFFGAVTYWWPKFTGFRLDEKLGKYSFWCWFIGFLLAFLPLYLLGYMGATRRLNHYDVAEWYPLFQVAAVGITVIWIGFVLQIFQVYRSIKNRGKLRDETGDPWDARTLEWATSSPPAFYNFAKTPVVHGRDAFWDMKYSDKYKDDNRPYEDIHMPSNTSMGFFIGFLSCGLGFAIVWHIWWLAAVTFVGVLACVIIRLFEKNTEYHLSAEEVEKLESRKMNV